MATFACERPSKRSKYPATVPESMILTKGRPNLGSQQQRNKHHFGFHVSASARSCLTPAEKSNVLADPGGLGWDLNLDNQPNVRNLKPSTAAQTHTPASPHTTGLSKNGNRRLPPSPLFLPFTLIRRKRSTSSSVRSRRMRSRSTKRHIVSTNSPSNTS